MPWTTEEKGVWEGPVLSEGMGCTLKTSPDLPEHYYLFHDIYTLPFLLKMGKSTEMPKCQMGKG